MALSRPPELNNPLCDHRAWQICSACYNNMRLSPCYSNYCDSL